MHATIKYSDKSKDYQYFISFSTATTNRGNMWNATDLSDKRGKVRNLQVHKARAFVAWQRENRGVHIGSDMLFAELLIEALHGLLRRVVVLAEMTQHDVLHARMIYFGHKP